MATDRVLTRRDAMASVCDAAARSVIERLVNEAVAAADRFGLAREHANDYAAGIRSTLPTALATMRLPDSPERTAGIEQLAREVRAVSESHHIPRIVERGLTAIAIQVTREVVRRGAAERGFTADELEAEFVAFSGQLEARLFAG